MLKPPLSGDRIQRVSRVRHAGPCEALKEVAVGANRPQTVFLHEIGAIESNRETTVELKSFGGLQLCSRQAASDSVS
jgi:hypothetical protein